MIFGNPTQSIGVEPACAELDFLNLKKKAISEEIISYI